MKHTIPIWVGSVATQNWWDYFFLVDPPTENGKRTKATEGRNDIRYGK